MIEKFLEFWLEYNPDIITGWNVKFFDIPFLMNRFRRLMGDEYILKFSPWGVVSQQSKRDLGFSRTLYKTNIWSIVYKVIHAEDYDLLCCMFFYCN